MRLRKERDKERDNEGEQRKSGQDGDDRSAAEAEQQLKEYGFTLDPSDPEPTAPDPDDSDDNRSFEDWVREHHAWSTRNLGRQMREQQNAALQGATREAEQQSALQAKMDVGRKAHADFDKVVGPVDQDVFTPDMREAIFLSDNAAEVAYQLASKPDEARRIAELGTIEQIREIARFEVSLATGSDASPGSSDNDDSDSPGGSGDGGGQTAGEPKEPAGDNKQTKKPSDAPPPIETLGGRETTGKKDYANMSQAEFNRVRAQEEAEGY